MTEEDFRDFIEAHEWQFAKSMPKNPHFYVVREKCRNDDEFAQAVSFIRKYGFPKKFFKQTYIYLDVDEWSYWTMGAPVDVTIILNRAEI